MVDVLRSSSWVPSASTFPLLISINLSASTTVDNLWAITNVVLTFITVSIAFWISFSVWVSIDDVASSRTKIDGLDTTALANEINCFSPRDSLFPRG